MSTQKIRKHEGVAMASFPFLRGVLLKAQGKCVGKVCEWNNVDL